MGLIITLMQNAIHSNNKKKMGSVLLPTCTKKIIIKH